MFIKVLATGKLPSFFELGRKGWEEGEKAWRVWNSESSFDSIHLDTIVTVSKQLWSRIVAVYRELVMYETSA